MIRRVENLEIMFVQLVTLSDRTHPNSSYQPESSHKVERKKIQIFYSGRLIWNHELTAFQISLHDTSWKNKQKNKVDDKNEFRLHIKIELGWNFRVSNRDSSLRNLGRRWIGIGIGQNRNEVEMECYIWYRSDAVWFSILFFYIVFFLFMSKT